ncbi:MAG: hypothetical protein K8R54_05615 [Bacteroidales bacterium]|nr:hypothetical protein [Bacteroidales bacterium]
MKRLKKINQLILITFGLCIFIFSCTKKNEIIPENEQVVDDYVLEAVELPDEITLENVQDYELNYSVDKWNWTVHDKTMYIAAKQWGISDSRADMMSGAAHMPDVYDNEGQIPGTQNWRHGYVFAYGIHIWGNADECCDNNISGSGLSGKSSFYYYENGNQSWGDWYLGYASHYLQDVGNPWHTSSNIVQQLETHIGYEEWVDNNWSEGHNFEDIVNNDWYYYSVSDPDATVRSLAKWSNSKNSTVYDAYVNSGNPTGAGTGNSTLVSETKTLLKVVGRYTKGLIKYTLDAKNEW